MAQQRGHNGETAAIAKRLGLVDALNLDGGGSSSIGGTEGSSLPRLRSDPSRTLRAGFLT